MRKIDEFKQKYPEYSAIPDRQLADQIFKKYYQDQGVDKHSFDLKMGVVRNPYGASDELVQGATLGFGDEIQAGLMAPVTATVNAIQGKGFHLGDAYNKELRDYRAEQKDYRENNPVTSTVSGVLGGLATGGGIPSLAKMGAVKAGAALGAGFGALTGFGEGEGGVSNRLQNAMVAGGTGAALGAGTAAVAPLVGRLASSAGRTLKNVSGLNKVPDASFRRIGQAMEDDGLSYKDAATKLQSMMDQGKPVALADLGENMQSLGSYVAKQPGAGRQAAQGFLKDRQSGQTDRILSDIKKFISPTSDIHQVTGDLIAERRMAAAPIYEKAYEKDFVSSPHLDALMQRPSFKKAMKNAVKLMAEEGNDPKGMGIDFNPAGDVVFTERPNMQTLDYIKRGLDDVVEKYRDPTTGILRLNGQGRSVNNTLRSYVNELKRLNPDYADALAAWSGPTKSVNAMNLGRKFARREPVKIKQDIARLSDGDKYFYKIGVAKGLQDAAEKVVTGGNTARRLMGSPAKEKALAAIFDNPEDFARFKNSLNAEADMHETFAAGTRGSPTQPLQAEDKALSGNALSFGYSVAHGNPVQAGMAAIRHLSEYLKGVNGATSEEIAKILYQSDPEKLAAYIASIQKAGQKSRIAVKAKGLLDLSPVAIGVGSGLLAQ